MTNNTLELKGRNPIDKGKQTIENLFNKHKSLLEMATFISRNAISYKAEDYLLPNQNKFLTQYMNKTFLVEKKKNKLLIKLLANFVVIDVKECKLEHNDKSNEQPHKYYLLTLKNDNNVIEKNVEVADNSKSEVKVFETKVNSQLIGFQVCMKEAEFKTFIAKYVSPKVSSKVTLYTNSGVIGDSQFLYKNALVSGDKIIWADTDGYIKTGNQSYVKLAESKHHQPNLSNIAKNPQVIANELVTNLLECWDENIILPLITLGHMIMSIYYEDFAQRYGCPTLILYGETGTGKSTLVTVGLAIFGLSREALSSGGSTAKSNEYFCSKYNGMNVCIDDVKGETLTSSNFTSLVKGAYKAVHRNKMLGYGKEVAYINICSPLAYSTNEALPDLREVINRMNIVEIFGKVFNPNKFKYHEFDSDNDDNLKELSLILPEFIKMSKKEVLRLYTQVLSNLKEEVPDTQMRVVSNIAYAYTGVLLLLDIANVNIDDLDSKIIEYAKGQIARYESIETPVDRVLSEIVTLTNIGIFTEGTHFKIIDVEYGDTIETHIRFRRDVVLSIINKYYAHDKSKQVKESSFLSYAKNHHRFRGNNQSVRYDDNKHKVIASMCFNISGLVDFTSIHPAGVYAMSAQNLRNNLESNKM